MKIRIIHYSKSGNELDRLTTDVGDDDSAEVSERIHNELGAWVLGPGDTIKIVEVS